MVTLTGNETLYVLGQDANGRPAATTEQTTTGAIAALAEAFDSSDQVITALNTVGAGTITAAGIVGGVTLRGGSQSASPFTDTSATAALIIAALPSWAQVGQSFEYTYINNTDAVATIAGGSSVTVSGITTVQPNMVAKFLVTYATSSTVTMAGLSTSVYSPTGISTLGGALVIKGALTQTGAGANVFNSSSLDTDFTVKKLTSGNAIAYDAGANSLALDATTVGITGAVTVTGALAATGNIATSVAGAGLQIKEGSNARMGTATLSGGTIEVANTSAATGDRIFVQRVSGTGAEFGFLSYTISNGVSFTINSTDAQDDSVVNWLIIKPTA